MKHLTNNKCLFLPNPYTTCYWLQTLCLADSGQVYFQFPENTRAMYLTISFISLAASCFWNSINTVWVYFNILNNKSKSSSTQIWRQIMQRLFFAIFAISLVNFVVETKEYGFSMVLTLVPDRSYRFSLIIQV